MFLVLQLCLPNTLKPGNEDVVGAMPTGDAPNTPEWSAILLPTKVQLELEVWWYMRNNHIWIQVMLCYLFGFIQAFAWTNAAQTNHQLTTVWKFHISFSQNVFQIVACEVSPNLYKPQ